MNSCDKYSPDRSAHTGWLVGVSASWLAPSKNINWARTSSAAGCRRARSIRGLHVHYHGDNLVGKSPVLRHKRRLYMLKLYKRIKRVLHYHEAWAHGAKITEHWGIVGERGETAEHKRNKKLSEEKNLEQVLSKPMQTDLSQSKMMTRPYC